MSQAKVSLHKFPLLSTFIVVVMLAVIICLPLSYEFLALIELHLFPGESEMVYQIICQD